MTWIQSAGFLETVFEIPSFIEQRENIAKILCRGYYYSENYINSIKWGKQIADEDKKPDEYWRAKAKGEECLEKKFPLIEKIKNKSNDDSEEMILLYEGMNTENKNIHRTASRLYQKKGDFAKEIKCLLRSGEWKDIGNVVEELQKQSNLDAYTEQIQALMKTVDKQSSASFAMVKKMLSFFLSSTKQNLQKIFWPGVALSLSKLYSLEKRNEMWDEKCSRHFQDFQTKHAFLKACFAYLRQDHSIALWNTIRELVKLLFPIPSSENVHNLWVQFLSAVADRCPLNEISSQKKQEWSEFFRTALIDNGNLWNVEKFSTQQAFKLVPQLSIAGAESWQLKFDFYEFIFQSPKFEEENQITARFEWISHKKKHYLYEFERSKIKKVGRLFQQWWNNMEMKSYQTEMVKLFESLETFCHFENEKGLRLKRNAEKIFHPIAKNKSLGQTEREREILEWLSPICLVPANLITSISFVRMTWDYQIRTADLALDFDLRYDQNEEILIIQNKSNFHFSKIHLPTRKIKENNLALERTQLSDREIHFTCFLSSTPIVIYISSTNYFVFILK